MPVKLVLVVAGVALWLWLAASEMRHVVRPGLAHHPTRLSAILHRPLVARDVHGLRLAVVTVAGVAAWAGVWFVAGWWLVRHPPTPGWEKFVPDQPAPRWLWQTGAILIGLGIVTTFGVLASAPRLGTGPARLMGPQSTLVLSGVMALGVEVPLATAFLATPDNPHGDGPALLLLLPASMVVSGYWQHREQTREREVAAGRGESLAVARTASAWSTAQHVFANRYLSGEDQTLERTQVHWRFVPTSTIVVWRSARPPGSPSELAFEVAGRPPLPEGDGVLVGEFASNGALCVEVAAGPTLWPAYNPQPPRTRFLQ
jgi:hypothetical protein